MCVPAGVLIELGCLGGRVKTKFFVLGHACILHSTRGVYVNPVPGSPWEEMKEDGKIPAPAGAAASLLVSLVGCIVWPFGSI